MTRYLLVFDSYGLVFLGHPLWREDGCFLYMLLALASEVFLGSEFLETRDHILLSQTWDFPFSRLLRLAGSQWRYWNPPPQGWAPVLSESESESELLYDWPFTAHQFVLAPSPLRLTARIGDLINLLFFFKIRKQAKIRWPCTWASLYTPMWCCLLPNF
jgi:hypothetical protein